MTYVLCQKIVYLPGNSNTYCMRETGHEGKCSPNRDVEEKKEAPKTLSKEEILEKKYGPFSKDDPKSKRGF